MVLHHIVNTLHYVERRYTTVLCKIYSIYIARRYCVVKCYTTVQWRRQAFQTGGALHSMEDSRGGTRKNKRQKNGTTL